MNTTHQLPPTSEVRTRMKACREELAALKRLLRAAEAAERADAARRARQPALAGEGWHDA